MSCAYRKGVPKQIIENDFLKCLKQIVLKEQYLKEFEEKVNMGRCGKKKDKSVALNLQKAVEKLVIKLKENETKADT